MKITPARVVLGLIAAVYFAWNVPHISQAKLDFNALYCGSFTLARSFDPYRYEPLHTCEVTHTAVIDFVAAIPDPLPPFAIAAFIPLTWLDIVRASYVWWLILVASGAVVVWTVTRLTRLDWFVVAVCTIPALLSTPWREGSFAPLPIALICAAALADVYKREIATAVLLGCACMEPHLGLPAAASAMLLRPRLRIPLVVMGLLIAIASLFSGGAAMNIEYLTQVLPAHAASELGTRVQYSLSTILHLLGVPEHAAILAGTLQYCLFVVLGILVAYALRRRVPAAALLAPVAFAVGGGTFVHDTQIAAAIPFALLLASQLRSIVSWSAVALLAIPWLSISEEISWRFHLTEEINSVAPPWPGSLAEAAWRPVINQYGPTRMWPLEHLPVFAGLLLLYGCALWLAWQSWRGRRDSNPQPTGSKPGALSIELRPRTGGADGRT